MKKLLLFLLILCTMLCLCACGCKHANTEVTGAVEATCTREGYTGDTVCLDCDEVVKTGEVIEMLPHTETVVNASEAGCIWEGYTGDTVCSVCGATLETGEVIPATGHGETKVVGQHEPTCSQPGSTGEVVCVDCNRVMEDGELIDKLPHTPGEPQDVVEATCTSTGYTGNIYCTVCGERIERGEKTPYAEHTPGDPEGATEATCTAEGYTGTCTCTVCGEVIPGEAIPRLAHEWVDGVCAVCGWETPGLYVDGELAMTWDELIEGGYVTVNEEGTLKDVHDALYGRLVVSEDVLSYDYSIIAGSQIEELWSPCTVPKIIYSAFNCADALKTVRFFGNVTELGGSCFAADKALESIVIPEGVRVIPDNCFDGCASLSSVTLPEGLEKIGSYAFAQTKSLTTIEFPEGLKAIGGDAFNGSCLTEVVLPASVESLSWDAFVNCEQLERIDLSQTAITHLFEVYNNTAALQELLLPSGLVEGDSVLDYRSQVERLTIPDGAEAISIGGNNSLYPNESLREIVWPVSLKSAKGFGAAVNAETIYYRGSELQWSLVENREIFDGVTIIYNYEGE